jgi:hypothetical protein
MLVARFKDAVLLVEAVLIRRLGEREALLALLLPADFGLLLTRLVLGLLAATATVLRLRSMAAVTTTMFAAAARFRDRRRGNRQRGNAGSEKYLGHHNLLFSGTNGWLSPPFHFPPV